MAAVKCPACGERKGNRSCPALDSVICSVCCGTKRQKEIPCVETCPHLVAGGAYQLQRDVARAVISNFQSEADDVFKDPEVVQFVAPIERAFVEHFAKDRTVMDRHIEDAVGKLYLHLSGKTSEPVAGNRVDEVAFSAFRASDLECPGIPRDVKAKAMARILRSIRKSTGGSRGPRGYMAYIADMFAGRVPM